ncbi:MAG: GAF domain-containing protein [Chloroflexi bacterium]|nr:GAF domain-containing protein [Chloroflexota bacterium]
MLPYRQHLAYDPFLAPRRWMLRLGSRFYYPIAAVAVMLIIGIVVRDALLFNDNLRRLADLVLIGGVCTLVIFWRAERMWLRGAENWLVRLARPDLGFLWSGLAVVLIALGLIAFIRITGPNSVAANHLWPLFIFPLFFLSERVRTVPYFLVLFLTCLVLTLLRFSVSNTLAGVLTPPLWLATLAMSNFYLARRHALLQIRTELLRQIANELSNTPDIETSFETIAETIGYRLRYDHVRLWLLDHASNRLVLYAARGTPKAKWENQSLPANGGISGSVLTNRRSERWDNVNQCPHYESQPPFEWVHSTLAVPVVVAGQAVGVLDVISQNVAEFWEIDEEQLNLMADSIGIALARSQHARHEAERLRDTLWLAVSQLSDCASIQEMFDTIAREARSHFGADLVALYQLAPGTGYPLMPPLFTGDFHHPDDLRQLSVTEDSVLFDLLERWEPYYSTDATADSTLGGTGSADIAFLSGEAVRSVAFLPLGSRSERVGVLFLLYRSPREFSPLDKLSLEAFASLAAEPINRERDHWRKYEAFGGVMFGVHGPLTLSADSLRRLIGSAREVMQTDPATAQAALERAQEVARKLEMAAMLTRLAQRDELDTTRISDELRRAATKIVQFVEPRGACRVFTDIPPEADDLPIEVLDAVYCLAMEAIANAAFHGHARRIDIAVELEPTQIRLEVSDNGTGFDTATARHGPNGIFEGLELVQAQFAAQGSIESQPGAGTRLEVTFPCLADVTSVEEVTEGLGLQ